MADSLLRVVMAASNNGYRARLADSAVSGTIAATTFTATPMNTTIYDPLAMATVANPAKITVDVDGYYIAVMRTSYLGNVDGTRMIAGLWVNRQGGGFTETVRGSDISGGGISVVAMPTCGLLKLLGGDAVEAVIFTTTGASTTAGVSTLNTLELVFVGPS
jgi:hypothetical protein